MLAVTMTDFRKAILAELKRRGLTRYKLIQMLKGKGPGGKDIPAATVYDFLRDDTPINSHHLQTIFKALAMSVPKPKDTK